MAPCFPIDPCNAEEVLAIARERGINFVIIGPEAPLAAGVADHLRDNGLLVFGPGKAGARLEASKAYCKDFFERQGIPTARWQKFTEVEPAIEWVRRHNQYPVVVKASGLAAGKGVLICQRESEAIEAIREMLEGNLFGESGHEIVVEEFLDGEEASLMAVISGDQVVCFPASQDYKRIGDGDTGPNTGGMGAYAPAAVVTEEIFSQIQKTILQPTLKGLKSEGIDYRGVLFIGLMICNGDAKVLEFNVRFGDPECQVLLPLCKSDPLALFLQCAVGHMEPDSVEFSDAYSMIVVLAAKGYPGAYRKDTLIEVPGELPEGCELIHAGTRLDTMGDLRANGGRVLGARGIGNSLEEAAKRAYTVAHFVQWSDKTFRKDIGYRQLKSPIHFA